MEYLRLHEDINEEVKDPMLDTPNVVYDYRKSKVYFYPGTATLVSSEEFNFISSNDENILICVY